MLLLFRSEEVPVCNGSGGFNTSNVTSSPSATVIPRIPSCTSTSRAASSARQETSSSGSGGGASTNANRPWRASPNNPCCMVGVTVRDHAQVHP